MTSRVLLRRHVLFCCATTSAEMVKMLGQKPNQKSHAAVPDALPAANGLALFNLASLESDDRIEGQ